MSGVQQPPSSAEWATLLQELLGDEAQIPDCPDLPAQIGRYRVGVVLGRGGYGIVYLAYDDELRRPVAVKVPYQERVTLPEDIELFLAEARILASLDHPGIVPVYDVGRTEEGLCFIVSKLIDGCSLSQRLKHCRPSPQQSAQLIASVAEALHFAHLRRVVHRDIKPGNILLDRNGTPYLGDFGVALSDADFDIAGRYAGTPAYMSPEQACGEGHRVDGRSDIFSLGTVLYEMLTGQRPFVAKTKAELLEQIASIVEVRPPRQLDDRIPKELERICLKALAKRAIERYTTAADLAEDLQQFIVSATASDTRSAPTPATPALPNKVVPKGLHSFDAHDADFFLDLLPGPRNRGGLPECLRFWKQRLDERDPEACFPIGVLYGPSGCGKTSFVKAGLLPRLASDVGSVYVECSAEATESRLLSAVKKLGQDLATHHSLPDLFAEMRVRKRTTSSTKIVIILDQFEQWLHAHQGEIDSPLVQALRQCDGGRLQAMLMLRDDFWIAVTRFMHQVEVPLVEGHNCALFDLFDLRHAKKVLTVFGQAFGALPESASEISKDQRQFVEQAVAGLAEDGKVISVRLSLFAEMVKGRPWTPASLKQIGGTEGVGVTFLEEMFSSATAPPAHRYHQEAARSVLKLLLPESGANIIGRVRSQQELLDGSGYAGRRRDFADLLRILDSEIRLITPTDLGQGDPPPSTPQGDAKYYQLTHDYLVGSLREWLTRKQKDTWRGRAELRLVNRAATWNNRREHRSLPPWWEWLNIRLFTRTKDWTPLQAQMMRKAGQDLALRVALLAACATLLLGVGWESFGRLKAQALMVNLLRAPTTEVPAVIHDMAAYRYWLNGPLRKLYAEAEASGDARKQLHTGLALLSEDDAQVPYLLRRLLTGSPSEVVTIRTALEPHAGAIRERVWDILADPRGEPSQRLRAACFLAAYATGDSRWHDVSSDVAARLVTENALLLKEWAEALRPVARMILPALAKSVSESRGPNDQRTLAGLYAEFAAGITDGFEPLESVLAEDSGNDEAAHVILARRQATSAAALAAAGRWDKVWPLLRHTRNPTLRSYLIKRLGTGGVSARAVTDRLNSEQKLDVSVRRALILVVRDFEDDRLSASERELLLPELLSMYRDDPDPGIHSAAEWLLRQWGHAEKAQAIDRELATGAAEGDRQWYLTGQFQTMMIVRPGEIEAEDQSGQRRIVRVERPFAIASRELTLDEYLRFRPNHAADRQTAVAGDCPVNEVSWYDAAAYCNWLSQEEGIEKDQWCYAPNDEGQYAEGMTIKADLPSLTGYRLPTVQEWEYACRAGSVTHWSIGEADDILDRYAWLVTNSGMRTHPVGGLRPNDIGLFDLHGNVWEWCLNDSDGEGNELTSASKTANTVNDRSYRLLCGGTYLNDSIGVGSSARIRNLAYYRTGADGFRVARTLPFARD